MCSSQWKEDWKSEPKGKIYKFGLWKSFLNFITNCPIYLLVFMLKVNKAKEGLVIIFHKKDSEEFYNLWLCRNAINHKNEMRKGQRVENTINGTVFSYFIIRNHFIIKNHKEMLKVLMQDTFIYLYLYIYI